MPLFKCAQCGCMENTALSNYAWRVYREHLPPLCSECDPVCSEPRGFAVS